MMLPLFAEDALEFGLRTAIGNQLRQQASLRLLYTFFQERTKASYFDRAMQLGDAKYVATGRSFDGMTNSFVHLYRLYARTHFVYAAELALVLLFYGLHTHIYNGYPPTGLGLYAVNTFALWLFAVACWFSPWIFNPATLTSLSLRQHFHSSRRGCCQPASAREG